MSEADGHFPDELIAHVVRVWAAEVENAERLSKKVTGLVSVLALLFGLGLFKIDWSIGQMDVSRFGWTPAIWAVKGCLIISLVTFALGLRRALTSIKLPAIRLRPGQTASTLLRFSRETTDNPPVDSNDAKRLIFDNYVEAINELQAQNSERRQRVHDAESWFLYGLTAAMFAVGTYLLASRPYGV